MLHIGGRWLHTYYYISANRNEVQGQPSTSTLTEEGELQFPTQSVCELSLNINKLLKYKTRLALKIFKMDVFQYCIYSNQRVLK